MSVKVFLLFTPRGVNRLYPHRFCRSIFHLVYCTCRHIVSGNIFVCFFFLFFYSVNSSFPLLLCCSGLFMFFICLLFQMWPIHSEISNCVIKREEERCLEQIRLHDPKEDEKFGERDQRLWSRSHSSVTVTHSLKLNSHLYILRKHMLCELNGTDD